VTVVVSNVGSSVAAKEVVSESIESNEASKSGDAEEVASEVIVR
jgi:hypothetical protein